MKNKELKKLKERLFGEFIVAVEESDRQNALFKIMTGNGKTFHVFSNSLGFWIEDDKDYDDFYPDLESFFLAIGNNINNYLVKNKITTINPSKCLSKISLKDDIFEVCIYTGNCFKIDINKIKNKWDKKVLRHKDLFNFIEPIICHPFSWKSYFSNKYNHIVPNNIIIPKELLREF